VDDPVASDWYDGFFETSDWLETVAGAIPQERTVHETDFLVEKLGLEPPARILDLACGHGRIALELARRGYRVTGLDLSAASLERARRAAEEEGLGVDWVEADMREIPAGAELDGIVNVFTAFGYFDEEEENQRVLDGVARALRPGGRFLIDTLNLLGLAGRWRARLWDDHDGTLLLQEHRYDVLRGRNEARWTFLRPDGSRGVLEHSLRTYAPHELAAMLERAGLRVVGSWGGFEGAELAIDAWRLILLAEKPGG
jgi:SAM-dependent methyltransferase